MKKLLLASLVILMAQPAIAMKKKPEKISPSKQRRKLHRNLNRELSQAIFHDRLSQIKSLIEQGANPNTTDISSMTALHRAALKHDFELCKFLLERGLNVNHQDAYDQTPLMLAINTGKQASRICALLISYGAEVNIEDHQDSTALLKACSYHDGTVTLCKLLLDNGADIRVQNKYGHRPLNRSGINIEEMKILITHSRFYPNYTTKELLNAQQLTRLRLWAMKYVCPQLPKDLKEFILALHPDVWRDACATPLKLHTKKYNRVTSMPLTVLRTLIKHQALDAQKITRIVHEHKLRILEPLIHDCHQNGTHTAQIFINHLLAQNLFEEIEEIIRADLKPESTGWCSIQ